MTKLDAVCSTLAQIAPLRLAEEWDNVGLLVGDRSTQVQRVMTCLTITPDVVEEAVADSVDLLITHHPLPFQALKKITSDGIPGMMLLRLIQSGVAVYSAHTAFDSAANGINQQWSECLGMTEIKPLIPESPPAPSDTGKAGSSMAIEVDLGSGRFGVVREASLSTIAQKAGNAVQAGQVRVVGNLQATVNKVAVACGSGGSFLAAAKRQGCDALVTGEATFHGCLEARSLGVGLILLGHFASERFAMEQLAERLAVEHADLSVWPSRIESDPIQVLSAAFPN